MQLFVFEFDYLYFHCVMFMDNLFRFKEYWRIVENKCVVGVDETIEQRKLVYEGTLKDFEAMNYIFQAINHLIIETIFVYNIVKDIQDSMNNKYQGRMKIKLVQRQSLQHTFEIFAIMRVNKFMSILLELYTL